MGAECFISAQERKRIFLKKTIKLIFTVLIVCICALLLSSCGLFSSKKDVGKVNISTLTMTAPEDTNEKEEPKSDVYTLSFDTVYAVLKELGYNESADNLLSELYDDAAGATNATVRDGQVCIITVDGSSVLLGRLSSDYDLSDYEGKPITIGDNGNWFVDHSDSGKHAYGRIDADKDGLDDVDGSLLLQNKSIRKDAEDCVNVTLRVTFSNGSEIKASALLSDAHHAIVFVEARAVSCTEDGWEAYEKCEKCGYTTFELIKAQHTIIKHEAKAATCTEDGYDAYEICEKCDYTTLVTIKAKGHSIETYPEKTVTCTEDGNNAYEACKNCSYTTIVTVKAPGHTTETHPAKATTCTEDGWNAYETCKYCSYTTLVTIKAQGHSIVTHLAKPATCTEDGWKAYETCSNCSYTTYVKDVAKGHAMVNGKCNACGYSELQLVGNEVFGYDNNGVRINYNKVFLKIGENNYYVVNNIAIYNLGQLGESGDSDNDGLSNKKEIELGTDPLDADTDNDGANDGKEVAMGFDPRSANTSFEISTPPIIDNAEKPDTVKPTIDIELKGDQVNTLVVERDEFFDEDTLGYLGDAYRYDVDGDFDSATIGFEFDQSKLGSNSLPTIYSYDVEKGKMTPLVTTIVGNKATTDVTELSTFVLLDRYVFEKQLTWVDTWGVDSSKYTDVEIIFVIDDSGSMTSNDRYYQRLDVARDLIDKLPMGSKIGVVKFATSTTKLTASLTSDKLVAQNYLTRSYFRSSGSTYIYSAMKSSISMYSTPAEGDSVFRVMVVLSDGIPSETSQLNSAINAVKASGISVYTVGLGSQTSYFNTYLKPLSDATGGKFYLSSNASGLADIFDDIGEKIDLTTDSDNDGLLDYYEDNMVIFSGVIYNADKNDPDTDDDGLLDGEEIRTVVILSPDGQKMAVVGKVFSDPSKPDTDGDGVPDKVDRFPMNSKYQ